MGEPPDASGRVVVPRTMGRDPATGCTSGARRREPLVQPATQPGSTGPSRSRPACLAGVWCRSGRLGRADVHTRVVLGQWPFLVFSTDVGSLRAKKGAPPRQAPRRGMARARGSTRSIRPGRGRPRTLWACRRRGAAQRARREPQHRDGVPQSVPRDAERQPTALASPPSSTHRISLILHQPSNSFHLLPTTQPFGNDPLTSRHPHS